MRTIANENFAFSSPQFELTNPNQHQPESLPTTYPPLFNMAPTPNKNTAKKSPPKAASANSPSLSQIIKAKYK